MQVFKAFLKVVKKNMFTALVFTFVFILIAVMTANHDDISSFEAVKIKLTVFDEDNSPESRHQSGAIQNLYNFGSECCLRNVADTFPPCKQARLH